MVWANSNPRYGPMRHSSSLRAHINWRLVALVIAILTLCLAGALYGGGETRTATTLDIGLGAGWTCTPNLIGTVCERDVKQTAAKR